MTKRNRWPVTGTHSGDELTVKFTGTGVRDWFGHPDAPGGTRDCDTVENIEVTEVLIMGQPTPYATLSGVVQEMLHSLASEVDWEGAE